MEEAAVQGRRRWKREDPSCPADSAETLTPEQDRSPHTPHLPCPSWPVIPAGRCPWPVIPAGSCPWPTGQQDLRPTCHGRLPAGPTGQWPAGPTVAVCGNPVRIDHGEVTFGLTLYQSEANYTCKTDYYTLVGEETYRCSLDGLWVNSKGQSDPPTCKPVCGKPSNPVTGHGRIINGAEAAAGNFPWQVLVLKNGRGGGILIGEHWVMTAAQVIRDKAGEANPDDANNLHVFIGDTDVENLMKRNNLAVREVHVHPSYKFGYYDHDIALIRLKDPVTMDENTSPICLPGDGDESLYDAGTVGYVSGFGMTERNRISNLLKYVLLPMVQRNRCQEQLKKKQSTMPKINWEKFTENMFCAGFPEAKKLQQDSCQGDSGGPYASRNGDKWVATGIVSWGIGCGTGYGYYTKVSNYMDWIKGHLNS